MVGYEEEQLVWKCKEALLRPPVGKKITHLPCPGRELDREGGCAVVQF